MPKLNLSEATSKRRQNANLDKLDDFGEERGVADSALDGVEAAVGNFIEKVQMNLVEADAVVSGSASDIAVSREGNRISVTAPVHLVFIDKGVNGSVKKLYDTPFAYKAKRPPVDVFIDYVNRKGLADGKEAINAAYAIREKVFSEGMAPKNVYSKEIPNLVEEVRQYIKDFTTRNIIEKLTR